MPATLFVLHSGSREDCPLREALLTQIRGAQGRLVILPDPPAGTETQAELLSQIAGADAALVLLSPDLLAQQHEAELHALEQRTAAGMPLFPVLLAPCQWDRHDWFSQLMVLPRDGTPISVRPDPAVACRDIVTELLSRAGTAPPETRRAPKTEAPRRALILDLREDGGKLSVRYLLPYHQTVHETPPRPLPRLRDPHALGGDAIYDLLFPDPAITQRVLRVLFQSESPTPPRHPVHVRILTRDPALGALPYQRCAYNRRPLLQDGWTFALCPEGGPTGRETLLSPAKVVVHAPDEAASAGFLRALEEKLGRLSAMRLHPSLYRVSRDAAELQQDLAELRPHLLLCHGRGEANGYDGLTFPQLRALLEEVHRPLVLFLGGTPAPEWPAAALSLSPAMPLLCAARPGVPAAQVELLLTAWLGRFLGEGLDPVEALHEEWPPSPAAPAPLIVYAGYEDMAVRAEEGRRPGHHRAPLLLDRDEPRAMVDKHVLELQESSHRRVEVLIAYADQGNLLEEFAEQATDYVQRSRRKGIQRVRLSLPPSRRDLKNDLPRELRVQAGAEAHTPLSQVLRTLLHGRRGDGVAVLLLDYGVFGERHQAPLSASELRGLLEYARDHVDRGCPDDLRVVVYLAMLVPRDRQERFRDNMERMLMEDRLLYTDRFRFTLLPALDSVTLRHLHEFLSNPEKSSCRPALAWDAAQAIHGHSGGIYERAVALLKQAEATTYEQLIAELRSAEGVKEAPRDDSLF